MGGAGTYFARDAKYVYDGGFCNTLPDGGKQIILCLLMTGMVCLGDPRHQGVQPILHTFSHSYRSVPRAVTTSLRTELDCTTYILQVFARREPPELPTLLLIPVLYSSVK